MFLNLIGGDVGTKSFPMCARTGSGCLQRGYKYSLTPLDWPVSEGMPSTLSVSFLLWEQNFEQKTLAC